MKLIESTMTASYQGIQTATFFLDVEKALDCIWHEGFLVKLKEILLPYWYVHQIASFLRDGTFQVKIHHALSSERQIIANIPQGSVLVSVFSNDTPEYGCCCLPMIWRLLLTI